jgi:hypothetical protein
LAETTAGTDNAADSYAAVMTILQDQQQQLEQPHFFTSSLEKCFDAVPALPFPLRKCFWTRTLDYMYYNNTYLKALGLSEHFSLAL